LRVAAGDTQALRLSARSAARQNRDQAAIATYGSLELRLMSAEDYFLLGRALSRTGQDELALKALETARSIDPDRLEMLDELAQVYFRKKRPAAAKAIATRLTHEPGWEVSASLLLGTCLAELNDPAGAADALRRAFALDPEGKAAGPRLARSSLMLLARSLLQTDQPQEARRVLESIPQVPSDQESPWLLSRTFIQEKDWDKAAAVLRTAGSYRLENPVVPEPAGYVGEARCASCHQAEAESHLSSRHSATFAYARDATRLPWPDRPISDPADPRTSHTFHRLDRGVRVETRVDDKVFQAVVKYAFGSFDHFTTFVAEDSRGETRMLRLSFSNSSKGPDWVISTGLPPHPAKQDELLGAVMPPEDGERACLLCHTTNPRSIETKTGPESADHAIGCELCHGPGGNHVLAVAAKFSDPAIISLRRKNATAVNGLCGLCHSLNNSPGFIGGPDDPGWFRFEKERLEESRCHTESGQPLHCLTCHDAHANAEREAAPYEAKCLSCHGPGPGKTACPVNPTEGCIKCHMPGAWMEQIRSFKVDHYIRVQKRPGSVN
jgi:tetratricopeptide (TPR) repeat protein